jgi:hypothetical protein
MTQVIRNVHNHNIIDLLEIYHIFVDELEESGKFDLKFDKIDPVKPQEIADFVKEYDVFVPKDVWSFWEEGLMSVSFVGEKNKFAAGTDFLPFKYVVRDTGMLREMAENYDDEDDKEEMELRRLHLYGIPLTFEEPCLILDAQPDKKEHGIYRILYDGSPLKNVIAPDFTTFWEHWLAAGCFIKGNFDAYWQIVHEYVTLQIPHKDNLWLKYWDQQYRTNYAH